MTTGNEPSAGQMTNYRFEFSFRFQNIYIVFFLICVSSKNICPVAVFRPWASPRRSRGTGWPWTWALLCTGHHSSTCTSSYLMTTACCCLIGLKWYVKEQRKKERVSQELQDFKIFIVIVKCTTSMTELGQRRCLNKWLQSANLTKINIDMFSVLYFMLFVV